MSASPKRKVYPLTLRLYYLRHKEKLLQQQKEYYKSHKKIRHLYLMHNREKINLQKREAYRRNKTKILATQKIYYQKNKEVIGAKASIYRKNHPPKDRTEECRIYRQIHKKERAIYARLKRATDIQNRIATNLRSRLSSIVRAGSTIRDLGCSISELKFYLECKFINGMNWENYGHKGWHIDHVIPLAYFNLTDREQFLKACHYTNLQPLWAKENYKKGIKILC